MKEVCLLQKIYFIDEALKTFKVFSDYDLKSMPIFETGYLKNPQDRFLEEPVFFLLALNETSEKKRFPVLRPKANQIVP